MCPSGAGDRLRLDYVSPLPPVRSGIADYSADLLPHLGGLADVRVLALPGQAVAAAVAQLYQPQPADRAGEEGRLPLYQMGNNPYHDAVWDLAWERPGVLTLHDYVLHHLLLHRTLGQKVWAPYESQIAADHGWLGTAACRLRALSLEDDASLFALPANRALLRRQRGVLVHNRWAAERLREAEPALAVRTVPMGIPLPPPAEQATGLALRARLGIPAEALLLGSFGFQTPIKRTSRVIAALADPRLAAAHLLVVGEESPNLDLAAEARAAGVGERVHVTGFLSYADLEAAIAAADLCLNLRYPTAGETSASLLRVLAVGRAVVVSDYAQAAELPAEVAVRVPLGEGEVAALVATLVELLAQPARLTAMGEAARRYVLAEHNPAAAARAIVAACRELAALPPPGDAPARVPPPTSLTWSELPAELAVDGAAAPWPAGTRRELALRLTNPGPARWLAAHRGAGGLALAACVASGLADPYRPWLPLPADVAPGESVELRLQLRRPPGPSRLHLDLKVLGVDAARTPSWEVAL